MIKITCNNCGDSFCRNEVNEIKNEPFEVAYLCDKCLFEKEEFHKIALEEMR